MTDAPDCRACANLAGRMTCARPVASHWNPVTSQRRSRLNVDIVRERSAARNFTGRQRCGPDAQFFLPRMVAAPVE